MCCPEEKSTVNLSLVIFSCNKYSDLWEPCIKLLEENWGDRRIKTYLVTDEPTDITFKNVEVVSAGSGTEMSKRMEVILGIIETDYLLVTLDDYFFTKKIDTSLIYRCLDIVEEEKIDYFRLYTFLNAKYMKNRYKQYNDIYTIDTKSRYNINLYPAIFSKDFLITTVSEERNAWQYEVSLTKLGDKYGANCVLIKPNALDMLDVVRKGKILRPAYRYLKRNSLYDGNRPVMGVIPTIKINSMYMIKRVLPRKLIILLRKELIRLGVHFYSEEYEE